VPSYLLWRLTGQSIVDYTIAARTLLFDERALDWSDTLLNLFEIPHNLLPRVAPGGTPVGTIDPKAAAEVGLSAKTLCVLGGHDHLCAALAAGAHRVGAFTDSTGSANALLMLTQSFMPDPELARSGFASYAYVAGGLYTLKGGLKAAGSAVEWLARQLSAPGLDPNYSALEAEAKAGIALRAGPVWLPHLIGSGTPQGDRYSRAAVAGMLFEHNRGDLFRGLLESLAFWTKQNMDEMQALTGQQVSTITLTGGTTRLRLLSQIKATVTQRTVVIPQIPEAAATGAILLAGLGSGVFSTPVEAIASLRYDTEIIEPEVNLMDWYQSIYTGAYLPLYEALKSVNLTLEGIQGKVNI
jgi:xylulokinase